MPNKIFETGTWNNEVTWEFFLGNEMPTEIELCTAVFCIVKNTNGDFYLTKSRRGWEIAGGHIEKGEKVEQALEREVYEELGVKIKEYRFV
jgi:8-oxo-dGTP pyrophosphatase MutT (NUDIX family)